MFPIESLIRRADFILRRRFQLAQIPSLLLLFCLGCGHPAAPPRQTSDTPPESVWFEEVAADWGIRFVHSPGEVGRYFMPESIGSGAAIFDYDNDGQLDIYLLQNAGPCDPADTATVAKPNQLFRQVEPGKFENVSEASGANVCGRGMGVAAGDVNNDGWNDLFLTEYGRVRLLMNQHNGTFADVTTTAGLENNEWGTSASFVDYDRDGWLDIVVANYINYEVTRECFDRSGAQEYCGPSGFPPSSPRLFRNRGASLSAGGQIRPNDVRFEDATVTSGLAAIPGPGLGVVAADFDGDHWPDIFFADDAAANRLWINNRDGTFDEQAMMRGIAFNAMGQTQANMGIAIGDADKDGLFDIFVTHLNTESHALWKQGPLGLFQDASSALGVTRTEWRGTGFGTVLGDFDQDGFLDLAIANGGIKRASERPLVPNLGEYWSPYAERNQLLKNTGRGGFEDRSSVETRFSATPAVSRGLARADIDGDGALDLLVTNIGSPTQIYHNVAPNRGHWLSVRVVDDQLGGRDAYGETSPSAPGTIKQQASRILVTASCAAETPAVILG